MAEFPLCYSTVYDSVMQLGHHSLMAKLDVKSAFRLCPAWPKEHHLLGMRWQGQYYFDRVLPFGLRFTPFIFNCLAEAIEWLAHQQGITYILHYLDIAATHNFAVSAQHLPGKVNIIVDSLISVFRRFMHMHPRQPPSPLPSLPVCPENRYDPRPEGCVTSWR